MPHFGSLLHTVVAFVAALGVLILVHELGHYMVARWCGVKVLRFSLGFGRPVVVRRYGPDETEWVLSALPLGGFVKMLDEREGPVPDAELHRAFNRQSVWRRFAIVLAGPVANFILAIVLYWALFMVGTPGMRPLVAEPVHGTSAAAAGFANGDQVTAVAGEPVGTWQDLRWLLLQHAVNHGEVEIDVVTADGRTTQHRLDTSVLGSADYDADFLAKLGFMPFRPHIEPVIGRVLDDSAAARGGLKAGDRVVRAQGKPIADWRELVDVVEHNPGKPVALDVLRKGAPLSLEVTPQTRSENGRNVVRMGAVADIDERDMKRLYTEVRYGPIDAFSHAVSKTWDTSAFSLRMIGSMIVGDISWRNVSGPLTIADYAGQTASIGAVAYIGFLAMVSISLGVLNLLPVPLLDGGHLLYYSVEIVKGSPVPDRVMEIGQQVGMALLLVLMLFAFYNDINRLLSG